MDAEEKKAMEELKETVATLTKSVETIALSKDKTKEDAERVEKILAEVQAKQTEFETKRKGKFVDDEGEDSDIRAKGGIEALLRNKSMDEKVIELQTKNDEILLTSQILGINPKQTKMYQEFMRNNNSLKKAMDVATATEGAEWVPVGYSSQLFDKVRLALRVAGLHQIIPMPTNVYKPPIVSADAVGYLISEQTADDATLTAGNRITASTPGTSNFTLTAKKIGGRVIFSEELNEDSIVPIIPFISGNIVTAISTAIEKAIIDGDTAGTHQDSDVTATSDAKKAWDGYRKSAQSAAKVSLATLNGDNMMNVRKAMGVYGVDPNQLVWITGISGYAQLLNLKDSANNPLVVTVDKYGAGATILTGELGKLYGVPIVISQHVRENLNASGVYDGTTTTKTIIALVYRPGFIIGDRRTLKVKTDEDINTDQTVLVATTRKAFSPVHAVASNYVVGLGYNITS